MPNETPTLYGRPVAPKYRRRAAWMLRRNARKYRFDAETDYPLALRENPVLGPALGVKDIVADPDGPPLDPGAGFIAGVIRMGYGHYRIGMALASAARARGRTPYWFDLLAFDSPGARLIHDIDYWYGIGSRLSQRSKLFNRFVWDPLMGSAYKRAEKNYPVIEMCRLLTGVYRALPEDIPFAGAHPWLAIAARHAGLRRVVNIVPDNCPLGFHLAPGALHAVQSPSGYAAFRALKDLAPPDPDAGGVPPEELALAGHFIDHELAANIPRDCAARRRRIAAGAPRRVLVSVGGAGAQRDLLVEIVRDLLPRVHAGRILLLLNFGGHEDFRAHLLRAIPELESRATHHGDWQDTDAFAESLLASDGGGGVHTFLHGDIHAAVYATNRLMRAADLLVTKPSELAYYPVPKLMLQRVGGHEAWGAIRAAELGDGTPECATPALARQFLRFFLDEDDLLLMCCASIERLHAAGVYDGAYRAVDWVCSGVRPEF